VNLEAPVGTPTPLIVFLLALLAIAVVAASFVYHRRGREAPVAVRLLPLLASAAVLLGLMVVGGAAMFAALWAVPATGSGGIGSVSAGISEAIVETVLGAVVVLIALACVRTLGAGRPHGPPPVSSAGHVQGDLAVTDQGGDQLPPER
jgi:hypothetical protein